MPRSLYPHSCLPPPSLSPFPSLPSMPLSLSFFPFFLPPSLPSVSPLPPFPPPLAQVSKILKSFHSLLMRKPVNRQCGAMDTMPETRRNSTHSRRSYTQTMSVCPSVCLSVYPSVCLSVRLSYLLYIIQFALECDLQVTCPFSQLHVITINK